MMIERELCALDETMDTLNPSSSAAIIGLDVDSQISSWNLAAERMLGWSEDEVIGHYGAGHQLSDVRAAERPRSDLWSAHICLRSVSVPVHGGLRQARRGNRREGAVAIDNARLHHELRRGEARFRTLVEQIPAVLYAAVAVDLTRPSKFSP
jgi:PAS domain S-box-containing protein